MTFGWLPSSGEILNYKNDLPISCEGKKWNIMSGCSTPGRLLVKPPDSIWVVVQGPVWFKNHWIPILFKDKLNI